MSDTPESSPGPRRVWPFFLLAAVMVAVLLAIVWVRAEVERVKRYQRFDYHPVPAQRNDPLAEYGGVLVGGDADRGRKIFFEKPEASCGRCHRVGGQGGDNGPALDGVASRQTPRFILESLIDPNAQISKGYETVVVVLKTGSGISGVLRGETSTELDIHTPDDGLISVNKTNIVRRAVGLSPMPADFARLISKPELQDLMAFLTSLKTNAPSSP